MEFNNNNYKRTYLKTESRLQKGKWILRNNIYVYKCININCNNELHLRRSDLSKISGKCRKCADKESGMKRGLLLSKRPFESLYNKFIYDRKREKSEIKQICDITYEDFTEFAKIKDCYYCGDKVYWAISGLNRNGYKYNLDRIDSSKGYLKNNLVVCCWECNDMKSNYDYDKFVDKCSRVVKNHSNRKNQVFVEGGDICSIKGGSCNS